MIEMKVMGIALDTRTGSPIVVLHDKENRKAYVANKPLTRKQTEELMAEENK